MKDHLLKFDRKIRELKSMGAKMEELDIVCNLLITLPKRYNTLVTAIETMDSDKITLDFVKSRLLDEHQKHNPNASSEKSSTAAMNTSVTCYGHIKSQCHKKKKAKNWNKIKVNSRKTMVPKTPVPIIRNQKKRRSILLWWHTATVQTKK